MSILTAGDHTHCHDDDDDFYDDNDDDDSGGDDTNASLMMMIFTIMRMTMVEMPHFVFCICQCTSGVFVFCILWR